MSDIENEKKRLKTTHNYVTHIYYVWHRFVFVKICGIVQTVAGIR